MRIVKIVRILSELGDLSELSELSVVPHLEELGALEGHNPEAGGNLPDDGDEEDERPPEDLEHEEGVVRCGVVWCGVVWCGAVWCGAVWCGAVRCGVVRCGAVWCGVVVCGAPGGVWWCVVVCGGVCCGGVWCTWWCVVVCGAPGGVWWCVVHLRREEVPDWDLEADGACEEDAQQPLQHALDLLCPGVVDEWLGAEAQPRQEGPQKVRRAEVVAGRYEEDGKQKHHAKQHLLSMLLGHLGQQAPCDGGDDRRAQPPDGHHQAHRRDHGQYDLEQRDLVLQHLELREQDQSDHVVKDRRCDDQLAGGRVQHLASFENVQRDPHRGRERVCTPPPAPASSAAR